MNSQKNENHFTPSAENVLNLAKKEAQQFQHNYIGTEHLLLGLIGEEEGTAVRVLRNLGVGPQKVRSAIEFILGYGNRAAQQEIGLTPRSKKVIELATSEARQMQSQKIGTEHLLLGLLLEGEGIAAGVLESLGVKPPLVRDQLAQELNQPAQVQENVALPIASARPSSQTIFSRAFRVILYCLGALIAESYLDVILVAHRVNTNSFLYLYELCLWLVVAIVGLIFFFRKGFYRQGLKFWSYFWWIDGLIIVCLTPQTILTYSPHSVLAQHKDVAYGFAILLGVAFMGVAFLQPSWGRRLASRIPVLRKRLKPELPVTHSTSQKVAPESEEAASESENERQIRKEAKNFRAIKPEHLFADLILPENLCKELKQAVDVIQPEELQQAVDVIQSEEDTLETWGIPTEARVSYAALHLYGKPGTGKTFAAHALADYLNKDILVVAYTDFQAEAYLEITNKIQAAFYAATISNALLLIDEADTLFTNGLHQIISSQVRRSLEQFRGVVIFATNSIEKYNKAFETRIQHIHIPMPDSSCREQLWRAHLPERLKRAEDVNPAVLAREFGDLSGREIKRVIAEAAQMALTAKQTQLEMSNLQRVVTRLKKGRLHEDSDTTVDSLAKKQYEARSPRYTYEQLILADNVREDLLVALDIIQNEKVLFDQWGLRSIEPFPCTALNFYGPPGTGKTLAAHALADKLGQNILIANYAEIHGVYVGEGAQNADTIFRTAARENAVLFIDEADALLARRLTDIARAGDMMLNSLSNQMLICLENFHGVVIFATNMAQNYDKAFETRVRPIYFPMPNEECRRDIWSAHLPKALPQAPDLDLAALAKSVNDICGRDIKNAVIDAASKMRRDGRKQIEQHDLLTSIKHIKNTRAIQHGEPEQAQARIEHKELEERIRQRLHLEKPGQISSTQQFTRPLNSLLELPGLTMSSQPLSLPVGNDREQPVFEIPALVTLAQSFSQPPNTPPEIAVPVTPAQSFNPSVAHSVAEKTEQVKITQPLLPPLNDPSEEEASEMNTPTQPLVRLGRGASEEMQS